MQVFVRVVACLGVVLTVAGCVPAGSPSEDAGAGAAADTPPSLFGASPAPVERDVESPDVFSMTGTALWDGRPSLGGVWVAHSSVRDPERVIIRNTKNVDPADKSTPEVIQIETAMGAAIEVFDGSTLIEVGRDRIWDRH